MFTRYLKSKDFSVMSLTVSSVVIWRAELEFDGFSVFNVAGCSGTNSLDPVCCNCQAVCCDIDVLYFIGGDLLVFFTVDETHRMLLEKWPDYLVIRGAYARSLPAVPDRTNCAS